MKLLNYPSYFKYKRIRIYYETRALKYKECMLSPLDKVSLYVIIVQYKKLLGVVLNMYCMCCIHCIA